MNGICEWFLSDLFLWMEYVNVFLMVCFYEWNLWMCSSSFVYKNEIFGWFVSRLLIRMEYVNVFFIVVYTNGIALLLYLNTEPIFWPAFVIIIIFHTFLFHFVFIIYISTYWFISTMVNDDVIVFIIIPIRWFSKYRNVLY